MKESPGSSDGSVVGSIADENQAAMPSFSQITHHGAIALGITLFWLRFQGRRWWCQLGDLSPWSGGIHSGHTSQHLIDPYSFSHFLHGFLFYAFLRLVAGRLRWDTRLTLTVALECLWEVVENSGMVIGRYRQGTIALGYEGDSILNSLGDIASCWLGFWSAGRLPAR